MEMRDVEEFQMPALPDDKSTLTALAQNKFSRQQESSDGV